MADLQPPRGTHDLIAEEQRGHARVTECARATAARYGFDEWSTPIFEDTRVFSRTLGDTSGRRHQGDVTASPTAAATASPCGRKARRGSAARW